MIPIAEIEISLALAESGARVEMSGQRAAELLRIYKAWAEAPEIVWTAGERMTRGKFVEVLDE